MKCVVFKIILQKKNQKNSKKIQKNLSTQRSSEEIQLKLQMLEVVIYSNVIFTKTALRFTTI